MKINPGMLAVAIASIMLLGGCRPEADEPQGAPAATNAPSASATPAAPAADALMERARGFFKVVPAQAPAPADNVITAEKIALGRQLFFDGRLSSSGVISCNSCHNLGMGGGDGVTTSIGHGFNRGPRNAPTVYNAVFNIGQFWDGRAADLKAQAKGPIVAAVEMNAKPEAVVATLKTMPGYVEAFGKAFPGEANPISFDNVAKAIEAFEVTLVTPDAPFDRYLQGDATAIDAAAKRGLAAFMDKGCVACHNGVNIGGGGYFPFGVTARPDAKLLPPGDKGRVAVTRSASDEYVFRAAPLRNVALTAPYFHTGQVWTLREAVSVMSNAQLGGTLQPNEIDDVVAFLGTLTGRQPEVIYPQLPARTDATPLPGAL